MAVIDSSSSWAYLSIKSVSGTTPALRWTRLATVARQEVLLDFPTNRRIPQDAILHDGAPDPDL